MWYNYKPQHITKETSNYYTTKNHTLGYHMLYPLDGYVYRQRIQAILMPFQSIITCYVWEQSCGSWVHQIGRAPNWQHLALTCFDVYLSELSTLKANGITRVEILHQQLHGIKHLWCDRLQAYSLNYYVLKLQHPMRPHARYRSF